MAGQAKLPPLPCLLLDGTTGIQCRAKGPYIWNRNKPSLARRCLGDAETDEGTKHGMPFLMCKPAEIHHGHRSEPDTPYTIDWVIQEQSGCTRFKERE